MGIFFWIYIALQAVCILVYFINRRRLPEYLYYLMLILLISITTEIIKHIFRFGLAVPRKDYAFLAEHIYQPFEFLIFSILFYHVIRYPRHKRTIKYVFPLFFIASITGSFIQGWFCEDTFSLALSGFLLLTYSCMYIYENSIDPPEDPLTRVPFYWINMGLAFYYGCSTIQKVVSPLLPPETNSILQEMINHNFNFIMYGLFLVGLACTSKLFQWRPKR